MDASEGTRLATQAFEAINEVVRASSPDTVPMVVQLIPLMVAKVAETTSAVPATAEAAERQSEMQVGGRGAGGRRAGALARRSVSWPGQGGALSL